MAKNKNHRRVDRNAPAPAASPPKPAVPALPKPAVESDVDRRQDRRISRTQLGVAASLVLSVTSSGLTCWMAKSAADANRIAQAAQDRAAGRIQARFEFVADQRRDPDRLKEFVRKKDATDQMVFRIESADELSRWSPRIRIKNVGTEPIDAIKTDVQYDFGAVYGVGVQQIDPAPIVLNETSSFEATAFGKLEPEHTATFYIAPLLLSQITRLDFMEYADKDHFGVFTARVYCRLFAASSYDRMLDNQPVWISFHWRPSGFRPDAKHVKDLLEKKPWVVLD